MLNRAPTGPLLRIVLLALTAVGCTDPLGPVQDALVAARVRWATANIHSYVFEFQRSCFCAPDFVRSVRIEVLDGIVNAAVYVDTEEAIPLPLASVPTIEDLFDEIQDAMDRKAFSVVTDFDPDLGYPTSVAIDFIQNAIDDEMAFGVSSLQFLDRLGN